MYTLKSIIKRGSIFGAAAALLAATVVPGATTLANALNPLTERSLLLTSSAPGYMDTDGSGNSEDSPNAIGQSYAPPGSGPNGKKSGQTFSFKVSTDSVTGDPIRAFSLQYCTKAAGYCQAPGNNSGDARDPSDRMDNATAHALAEPTSDFDVVTDSVNPWTEGTGEGTFQVTVGEGPSETVSTGWEMNAKNVEDDAFDGSLTGKNNFIFLTNDEGGATPAFNEKVEIKFTPSSDSYITNPGSDEFFVKINTYSTGEEGQLLPTTDEYIIDGGVTVANVMTDSIHITTKVLETMQFSVGTENKDATVAPHGSCDPILTPNNNRLNLGNHNAEYSLETGRAWDVNSYWRLSSNSSGGATVYYSGDTLRNTVGDYINSMEAMEHSIPGTEQFGLALVNPNDQVDWGQFEGDVDPEDGPQHPFPVNWNEPSISPLVVGGDYSQGEGPISNEDTTENAQFRFNISSQTVPEVVAQNDDAVISCATSKVRYVANIAASTPAGVYTTKVNFLAAPQY